MKLFFVKQIIIGFLILNSGIINAQIKKLGLSFIVNYSRNTYQASTQNWSVSQCSKGFLYFGNNDGILEYDGSNWRIYPVPNYSVVRSVLAVGDTIYAGAFEEIGFLASDNQGQLVWNSLNHLVPDEYRNFDEVWKIFKQHDRIIFQSFSYIFILKGDEFKVIEPEGVFSFMHRVDDQFFIVDRANGLMVLEGDSLRFLSSHPVFFRNEIVSVLPFEKGKFLIGTNNEGVFIWDGSDLSAWDTEVNFQIRMHSLFSGLQLSNGSFAFGTIGNGVYIADRDGNVLQHLNRIKGLQSNTVLALFQDSRNNLWMGLDNGIDFVEISSPVTILNYNFNIETAYKSIIHNDILYVGTNQGLYAARVDELETFSFHNSKFQLIKGTEGQVWELDIIDNTLLCGHNMGCFQIDGFTARQISDIRGFWSFLKPETTDNIIIAGTYTGLVRLQKQRNQWQLLDEVDGFRESSRSMFADDKGYLWVSHGYRGLFRLSPSEDFSHAGKVEFFKDELGLPAQLPYNIQTINGEMVVTTYDGIYIFDYNRNYFVLHPELNDLFAGKGFIDKIQQDRFGNLWYFTIDYLGVMRLLEDGTFRDITAPFSGINSFLIPAFQNIFIQDINNVFIGTQYGLAHYSPTIINDYSKPEEIFFREISFYGRLEQESFYTMHESVEKSQTDKTQIPFALNSVMFRFTTPVYENPDEIRFSFRLGGFDENWSAWDAVNFKEYTNLREGSYVFEVKSINSYGIESPIRKFHFIVEPPFLRSRAALIIYTVLFLMIVAGNFYFVRRRMLKIRQREIIRHEKRLARKEQIFQEQSALSEKEIMHLRNESLQTEMKHKNKELANATLHLIQKNRTLTGLKNDLNKLLRSIPADNPEKQNVNNLLKKVNKDLRNEKNWELFNSYFDEVHQDFISRIKEKHSDLTPKELRMCAYLRMNISTKEIAPLMNISVRGVEISRYRLRKKLNLNRDENLTEYILSF
jgi:ligand-binding sensor domain-containing protein/DNA-binding CsgD family transcriptional regulator